MAVAFPHDKQVFTTGKEFRETCHRAARDAARPFEMKSDKTSARSITMRCRLTSLSTATEIGLNRESEERERGIPCSFHLRLIKVSTTPLSYEVKGVDYEHSCPKAARQARQALVPNWAAQQLRKLASADAHGNVAREGRGRKSKADEKEEEEEEEEEEEDQLYLDESSGDEYDGEQPVYTSRATRRSAVEPQSSAPKPLEGDGEEGEEVVLSAPKEQDRKGKRRARSPSGASTSSQPQPLSVKKARLIDFGTDPRRARAVTAFPAAGAMRDSGPVASSSGLSRAAILRPPSNRLGSMVLEDSEEDTKPNCFQHLITTLAAPYTCNGYASALASIKIANEEQLYHHAKARPAKIVERLAKELKIDPEDFELEAFGDALARWVMEKAAGHDA